MESAAPRSRIPRAAVPRPAPRRVAKRLTVPAQQSLAFIVGFFIARRFGEFRQAALCDPAGGARGPSNQLTRHRPSRYAVLIRLDVRALCFALLASLPFVGFRAPVSLRSSRRFLPYAAPVSRGCPAVVLFPNLVLSRFASMSIRGLFHAWYSSTLFKPIIACAFFFFCRLVLLMGNFRLVVVWFLICVVDLRVAIVYPVATPAPGSLRSSCCADPCMSPVLLPGFLFVVWRGASSPSCRRVADCSSSPSLAERLQPRARCVAFHDCAPSVTVSRSTSTRSSSPRARRSRRGAACSSRRPRARARRSSPSSASSWRCSSRRRRSSTPRP